MTTPKEELTRVLWGKEEPTAPPARERSGPPDCFLDTPESRRIDRRNAAIALTAVTAFSAALVAVGVWIGRRSR